MPRRIPRPIGLLASAVVAAALLTPIAVSPAHAAPSVSSCTSSTLEQVQARILSETNTARSKAGLGALKAQGSMHGVAVAWSAKQAAAGTMSHNPAYSTQIPSGWSRAGENVASGYAAARVTTAWLNSPGHRANILGQFTHIGIGVACSSSGTAFYTQVFAAYKTAPAEKYVTRAAGYDRYATAATISAKTFSAGVPVAYLASGTAFPDALSGAAAAGSRGGPVLLTSPGALSAETKAELRRLRPGSIIALGGGAAVSDSVLSAAREFTTGTVSRAAGSDRYGTSAAVSAATFPAPGVPVAYLSSGRTFPDALAGAAAAGAGGGPVLLTSATGISDSVRAELQRLKPRSIVVLGGTGAVSDAVLSAARDLTSGTVSRVSGADRYATAAAVSRATFGAGTAVAYIADGATFPDALAGAAAAGVRDAPVLLTARSALPSATATELGRLRPARIIVLGGPGAVSDAVLAQLSRYAVG